MKLSLFIFIFLLPLRVWSSPSTLAKLIEQAQSQMQIAQSCVPTLSQNELRLCTGVTLDKKELNEFLQLDRNGCEKAIQQHGYTLRQALANDLDFIRSTRRAETYHEQKLVLFKKDSTRIDCIHEYLHVLQRTKATGPLAPVNRAELEFKLKSLIEIEITQIEKLERNHKKKEAQKASAALQPAITTLKEWDQLTDWLDEKDPHYLIFSACDRFKCSEEDKDIALANLSRLQLHFPVSTAKQIEIYKHAAIHKMKVAAFLRMKPKWKSLTQTQIQQAAALATLGWKDLLSSLKDQGVRIIQSTSDQPIENLVSGEDTLPLTLSKKLPSPNDEEKSLLGNSKILHGRAMGKFLCTKGARVIVVSPLTNRPTLIHEFLHSLQSLQNESYCEAITEQPKTARDFSSGNLSRNQYEEIMLNFQAINALAEIEVYESIKKLEPNFRPKISDIEIANSSQMLEQYRQEWN